MPWEHKPPIRNRLQPDWTPILTKAPRMLSQVRPGPDGHPVIEGIKVEFCENGRLKYFADVKQGRLDGTEMTWDSDGRLLSQKICKNSIPAAEESGS